MSAPNWIEAGPTESLIENGSTIFKYDNKQILIIHSEGKFYVCNNRCPHEGFPLREGTVTGKCILTCNWHNWKFDLETGKTLVGGDQLRRYPTKIENDTLFIDVTDPPATDRIPEIMANLDEAMDDYDYTRIARELARLEKVDADPLDAVRFAIQKTSNKFEWGMTHAYAAAADWLTLREQHASDPSRALTCLLEPIAHMAWDTLREKEYPYTNEEKPFDGPSLVAAFEAENEDEVIGLLRGALSSGMSYPDLEPWLAEVALAHYADFGHSAIYVFKCGQLIEQLGNDVLEPVLFALARQLIYATREDLLPEFRQYAHTLEAWHDGADKSHNVPDFRRASVNKALKLALHAEASHEELYLSLLDTAAWEFLHFDTSYDSHWDRSISQNVGWLDYTHMFTFANAARQLCERYEHLWPQAILHLALFTGRNASYLDEEQETAQWKVNDTDKFASETTDFLFDHGIFEHIVSCHHIKLTFAVLEEIEAFPKASFGPTLLAAINRLQNSPLRRRHVRRTITQARAFVDLED